MGYSSGTSAWRSKRYRDLAIIVFAAVAGMVLAIVFDPFEVLVQWAQVYERWKIGELVTVSIILMFCLGIFAFRRWIELEREIAARRRAEQGLGESEGKYHLLAENIRDVIWITDMDLRLTYVSPSVTLLRGYSVAETMAQTIEEAMTPASFEMIQRARSTGAASQKNGVLLELELYCKDGSTVWTETNLTLLRDREGQLSGVLGVTRDVTKRKQAETALQAQKRLFEDLVTLARATAEQPTLEATLQNALDMAIIFAEAELGSLLLLDDSGVVTHGMLATGEMMPMQKKDTCERISSVMERGLAGWVTRHRQSARVEDTRHDDRWLPLPGLYEARSALSVPIIRGATLQGVLTLTHSTPAHFDPEHSQLIKVAADQMALALHNAQIYDGQRRLVNRQVVLYQVLHTAGRHLDPQTVASTAVETTAWVTQWPAVTLVLPDDNATCLIAYATAGVISTPRGVGFPIDQGITGRAFRTGQTQHVPDVSTDPDYLTAHPSIRSELAVPLRRGERVLGVLDVESDRPAAFDSDDVLLAESLAEAIALALDNARLHAEAQRQLQEQTLLREAGTAITSTLDLADVLSHIAEQMGKAVDATSAYICGWEPAAATATVLAEYFGPHASAQERVSDRGATYVEEDAEFMEALQAGRSWVDHVDDPGLLEQDRSHMQQYESKTILYIPLQIRGEIIGYAELWESRKRREFSPEEIGLCQGIAQQAAIAVANAHLYEEVRVGRQQLQNLSRRLLEVQENERRHIARELHDQVGQTLTALKLMLDMAIHLPPEHSEDSLNEAEQLVDKLAAQVSGLSLDLRPAMLDDLGLLPALLWHIEHYTAQTRLQVAFKHTGAKRRFTPEVETTAYRLVQEALTNVARHAGVDEVSVRLWADEDTLNLQIEDQGVGFDPQAALAAGTSSGLSGMHERVALLEGRLTVDSAPGRGTRLLAQLPLHT